MSDDTKLDGEKKYSKKTNANDSTCAEDVENRAEKKRQSGRAMSTAAVPFG